MKHGCANLCQTLSAGTAARAALTGTVFRMSDTPVTIMIVDQEAQRVLLQALDLYQRVGMGQWRAVAEASPDILGEQAGAFSEAAEELIRVRCQYSVDPALRDFPNASRGIAQTGRTYQVAYDLWHILGGGMPSRRDDRLTDVLARVESPLWDE